MVIIVNHLKRLVIWLCPFSPWAQRIKSHRRAEQALYHQKSQLVVILMGYTGSGKSRFARLLSQRIRALWQNSELTSEKLFGQPYLTDPVKIHETFKYMEHELADAVHGGQSVIRDYTHNKLSQRQGVYRLVAESGDCTVVLVWIKTPKHVAIDRRLTRKETPYQQRGLSNDAVAVEKEAKNLVDEFNRDLQKPGKHEPLIVIDGQLPFEKQYSKFLDAYIRLSSGSSKRRWTGSGS